MLQDFPYACEPGIEHHNIWCTKAMTEEEIGVVVEKHRPVAEGWEVLTFVNPVELQSIRAVRITAFFASQTFMLFVTDDILNCYRFQPVTNKCSGL